MFTFAAFHSPYAKRSDEQGGGRLKDSQRRRCAPARLAART
jgi:hypothetical protein